MKVTQFTYALALLLAVAFGHTLAVSDESPKPDPERMKRIKEITSPGPQHKQLEYYLGTWDVEARLSMHGRDMEPSKMSAEYKWVIPGRWLTQEIKGPVKMGPVEFPYHGFFIHGYDNHTKNYVTCGVQSMDTSMNMFRGVRVDPEDKVFTQYGTINEYMDGTFNKPVKVLVRKVDENRFDMEIWDLQIGASGQAVIKYKYTRRK